VTFEEMEQALRQRLEALPPAARAELIPVLRLPDFDPADRDRHLLGTPGDADVRRVADRPGGGQGAGCRIRVTEGDGAEVVVGGLIQG
jgi:hypothetical protein